MNRWIIIALAALTCGIEAVAADAPVVVYSAKPMPQTFAVLTERSIFYKGRDVPAVRPYGPRPVGPTTRDSGSSQATQPSPGAFAEQTLVFNGVTRADNLIVAFVEDQGTSKVTMYRIGESIARGKITDITLDDLTYLADGKTVHVGVGENLQGVVVQTTQPAVVNSSASHAPGGTSSSGTPSSASPSPSSGGGDTNDVLERLRKRRQQELQGK